MSDAELNRRMEHKTTRSGWLWTALRNHALRAKVLRLSCLAGLFVLLSTVLFRGLGLAYSGTETGTPLNLYLPGEDTDDWDSQVNYNFQVIRSSVNALAVGQVSQAVDPVYINLSTVTTAINDMGALKVAKAGDTMTGHLTSSSGLTASSYTALSGTSTIKVDGNAILWADGTRSTSSLVTAATALRILGGATGRILYQASINRTDFLNEGSSGQILRSNGASTPGFTSVLPELVKLSTANITPGFNAADRLVQLDSSGRLPAVDGSQITGLAASVCAAGDSTKSVICSGQSNTAKTSSEHAAVIGGVNNQILGGISSAILAGSTNYINNTGFVGQSVILGGRLNQLYAQTSLIFGYENIVSSAASASILLGRNNEARKVGSTISGGAYNIVHGDYGSVLGGYDNQASTAAFTAGGEANRAYGEQSAALGYRSIVSGKGSFAWADTTASDFVVTSTNTFNIRANGGFTLTASSLTITSSIVNTGKALCLNASNHLSYCTSAVDGSGNCTCN